MMQGNSLPHPVTEGTPPRQGQALQAGTATLQIIPALQLPLSAACKGNVTEHATLWWLKINFFSPSTWILDALETEKLKVSRFLPTFQSYLEIKTLLQVSWISIFRLDLELSGR